MQYNDTYTENVFSFANNIDTVEGGTHLEGFRCALTRVINDYGRKATASSKPTTRISPARISREGLTAVVSVKLDDPQFEEPDQDPSWATARCALSSIRW